MNYTEERKNLKIGVFTIIFGVLFAISCYYEVSVREGPGVTGRAFPLLISFFFIILGSSLVVGSIREVKISKCVLPDDKPINIKRVLIYIVSICLYILGISYAGYVLSGIIMMIFLFYFYNHKIQKIVSILMIVIVPSVLWYCFTKLLEVQLPETLLF